MTGPMTRLRWLVTRPEMTFLMEAHDGLSAKIVQEAGFEGIWASGLTMSAAFGVRDNNELSWSQVAEHAGFMAEATSIPVLLDGDTGYGNFNNTRRLVRKLEQMGVAGVTIEDKQFPKTNSFLRSERQPLADVDEFCGKLKAAKDSQNAPDFVVVARVEALIAGWGLAEALRRAEAYHLAGADAILIHSRSSRATEIFQFLQEWGGRCPVVLVPTTYYTTPTEDFRARGISVVIWANHLLRAAITAMQTTTRRIREDESLVNVEPQVAPLREVFRLQGDEELEAAERRYLPVASRTSLSAVVLAAGGAESFASVGTRVPRAMLPVRGRPLLERLLEDFAHFGCRRVTVVRGAYAEAVTVAGASYVDNPDHTDTGEAYSLSLAMDALEAPALVSFGDIVIKRHLLHSLLDESGEGCTLLVDSALAGSGARDRVRCDRPYTGRFSFEGVGLVAIDGDVVESHGVWIGLMHVGSEGTAWLREAIEAAQADGSLRRSGVAHLIARMLAAGHPLRVAYCHGSWVNVNNVADLLDASAL